MPAQWIIGNHKYVVQKGIMLFVDYWIYSIIDDFSLINFISILMLLIQIILVVMNWVYENNQFSYKLLIVVLLLSFVLNSYTQYVNYPNNFDVFILTSIPFLIVLIIFLFNKYPNDIFKKK